MFACQIFQAKGNGTTWTTRMLLFSQRNKDNPERVFRQERPWVSSLSISNIFFYCFNDNNVDIPLHIVFNSKWINKKAKKKGKGNIKCFSTLFMHFRKCVMYFIFNILSFYILTFYISAMFFIRVVWKLSVDQRPQELGLKGVYGLKFFHLAEDD